MKLLHINVRESQNRYLKINQKLPLINKKFNNAASVQFEKIKISEKVVNIIYLLGITVLNHHFYHYKPDLIDITHILNKFFEFFLLIGQECNQMKIHSFPSSNSSENICSCNRVVGYPILHLFITEFSCTWT